MTEAATIVSLRARPVVVPLSRPLRTAAGAIPAAPLLLLDVTDADGVIGRAYVFGYTPITLRPLAALAESLAELVIGKPAAPSLLFDLASRQFRLLGRQGLLGMALSGLDMALWDLLGRAVGRPVAELLGGGCRAMPAYDSFGLVDPVADRATLEASVTQGFRAIKIKVGDGSEAADAYLVRAVRDIVGPEVRLMVDFNQSQDVMSAIRRIERLAPYDITWVEEPVAAEDFAGHARVRAASSVPVQTGENWWFPRDMERALAAGACDFAMPDLMKIGGVTGWVRVMGLAEAAAIPLSSHLFVEASAHVLAVSPTAHFLEYLDVAGPILTEPARPVGGLVAPRGPGLGIEWDEGAVLRYGA